MGETMLAGKPGVLEADPFAPDPIQRDHYGRPLIIPVKKRGGQPDLKAKLVAYTRVSTFASCIGEPGGLIKHGERHTALGIGRDENLAAMVGVFGPTLADCSQSDKIEIDRIIELAKQISGGYAKANHGTAVHGMTEPGRDPFVPERMTADVASYHKALVDHGIEVVSTEQFVVCDELQVAGTFDHLYRFTREIVFLGGPIVPAGTLIIGDKKTGALHLDSQSIQLAVYARGKLYDPETGERTSHGAILQYGLLVHIPKGEGRTDLYLVDLTKGWAAAQLAGKVRAHRTDKTLAVPLPRPVRITVDSINPDDDAPDNYGGFRMVEVAPGVVVPAVNDGITDDEVRERFAAQIREPCTVGPDPYDVPDPDPIAEQDATIADLEQRFGLQPVKPIIDRLNEATTRDELADVWHAAKAEGLEWTEAHTAMLRTRAGAMALRAEAGTT